MRAGLCSPLSMGSAALTGSRGFPRGPRSRWTLVPLASPAAGARKTRVCLLPHFLVGETLGPLSAILKHESL